MKIIAIPTKADMIEDHFGQCEYYTIVKVDDQNQVASKETFSTPGGCGCRSNLAQILAEKGTRFMLAGHMGQGALNHLKASGIEVMCGFHGKIDDALDLYLNKGFTGNNKVCEHHHHDHGHDHHH
jgi:predicted Fe-Mo cluster-binding NifX family protein